MINIEAWVTTTPKQDQMMPCDGVGRGKSGTEKVKSTRMLRIREMQKVLMM